MRLQQLRDALYRDLSRPLAAKRLHDAISEEPTLRALGTPDAILALLHDRSLSLAERNATLAALVRTAQRKRPPELSALLIVAFHPGLVNLCSRLRVLAPRAPDGSLAMLVLEAFIETVHTLRIETQAESATMGLLFGTRRAAFAQLHRGRHERDRDAAPIDAHHEVPARTADPEVALVCREVALDVTHVLTQRLRVSGAPSVGAADWAELSDLMVRARRAPCAARTDEERREYKRVQRARHRALHGRRLENIRDRLSPIREHLPLLQQEGWQ